MKEAKVWNLAVFVTQYKDCPNLDAKRFELIKSVAADAIASFPAALNYGQSFHDKELLKALTKPQKKPSTPKKETVVKVAVNDNSDNADTMSEAKEEISQPEVD